MNLRLPDDVAYRLRLAEGFLEEARQDAALSRWRSCVDNSQLAVENAAKVGLALLGPVGRTHHPAALLRRAAEAGRYSTAQLPIVQQLMDCAELLGPDLHAASDYGDEATGQTPWELFSQDDAQQALDLAEKAVNAARAIAVSISNDDRQTNQESSEAGA